MAKFKPRVPAKIKPKFNVQDFTNGMDTFGNSTAKHFMDFVQERYRNNSYDFSVIEQRLNLPEGSIKDSELADKIEVKDHIVFISNGVVVQQLTYKELFSMLEYGRKDKGILPNPIIRKAFDEYFPIYKLRLRNFLLGKK